MVPWSNGDLVRAKAPFVSPWRMLSVENKVGGLVTNRVMLNLNDPCKIKDTSWITTGKYVGVWWSYHMQTATWAIGPKHGATTENTKRYIDFAAQHGFKGVLVEGWNYGWENDWGKEGDKFNFTKAYPDYDFDGLQKYALSRVSHSSLTTRQVVLQRTMRTSWKKPSLSMRRWASRLLRRVMSII